MPNESTDVLMAFLDGSNGVPAECQSVWAPADNMKMGFTEGNYFEIEDFSFGGGLESAESDEEESRKGSESTPDENGLSTRGNTAGSGKSGSSGKSGGSGKKKSARSGLVRNYILGNTLAPGAFLLQEISISRQLDKASPVFLQKCLAVESFTKALVVKRKVVGNVQANMGANVELRGFLRFEFKEPLITNIDWEDGEVVKEKLKFVCRGVKVIYRPQKPDGSLGPTVEANWDPLRLLANADE